MKLPSVGLLSLVLVLSAPVLGVAGEGHGGKDKEGKMADLKLTDQQKEKFKPVQEERKAANEEHREKMKSIRERLQKEVDAATPNEASLKSLLGELESTMAAHEQKMRSIKDKMKQFLTPLQQARLALKFGKDGHGGKGRGHEGEGKKGRGKKREHHED